MLFDLVRMWGNQRTYRGGRFVINEIFVVILKSCLVSLKIGGLPHRDKGLVG